MNTKTSQVKDRANNVLKTPKVKMFRLPIVLRVVSVKSQFQVVQNANLALLGKQEPEETVLVHHAVLENTGLAK